MNGRFNENIRFSILKELVLSRKSRSNSNFQQEFIHLENAHILGQQSTYWHTKVHVLMLLWAKRQANRKEFTGQIIRIAGAFTKTAVGLVPEGNTGGTNISPFKVLHVNPKYAQAIARAKSLR